jgi:N12 class adenine-specific DNA methylase
LKQADPIENFFKNFFNQAKNPSHTGFYAVTVDMLDKVLKLSDEDLEKYRINPKDYMKNKQEQSSKQSEKQTQTDKKEEKMETTTEQKTEFKQFDTSRIPDIDHLYVDESHRFKNLTFSKDMEAFNSRGQYQPNGVIRLNPVQLDRLQGSNPKEVGLKLNEIAGKQSKPTAG